MGPHPAVAAIRLAVRRVLHEILDDVLTDHTPARPDPARSAIAPADTTANPFFSRSSSGTRSWSARMCRAIASAIGERHVFPLHTNRIVVRSSFSMIR